MPAREGAWAIYEPFATADGEQIFVGLTSDRQWRRFCEHFCRKDLLQNPAYKTNEDRVRERPALLPIVAAIVAQHTRAELAELFDRIDIPFSPVARPGDLFDDPQLNAGRAHARSRFCRRGFRRNFRGCRSRSAGTISG